MKDRKNIDTWSIPECIEYVTKVRGYKSSHKGWWRKDTGYIQQPYGPTLDDADKVITECGCTWRRFYSEDFEWVFWAAYTYTTGKGVGDSVAATLDMDCPTPQYALWRLAAKTVKFKGFSNDQNSVSSGH